MHKMEENQGAQLVGALVNVLLGGVAALGVCLIFLFGCSAGIAAGLLSEEMLYRLAIVGCVLGGFCGGAFAVRRCGGRALVVGLCTGGVLFLLLLAGGVLFFKGMSPQAGGPGLLSGALCGGAAAGILGFRPRKRKRKR